MYLIVCTVNSEWCSPLKMEPHVSSSTPGQGEAMNGRRHSPFGSTDTSGISSDASSDGVVFMVCILCYIFLSCTVIHIIMNKILL